MSKEKISVILPIYNVGNYIEEALDSILNQTIVDDLEVIMVDDESTDKSRHIIERYALDYDNFHAYHKKNEGQGIARNYGLNIAQGDFISFFDPDDFLHSHAYETLYDIALKYDSDIVVGNALRFARYNVWQDILFKNSFRGINEEIQSSKIDEMPQLVWDTVSWNKIYKREFLIANDINFLNKKISFQDIPFSLEAHLLADSISITPEICYYWRLRNDNTSVTQQDKNVANFKDRLEIMRICNGLLEKYDANANIKNQFYLKWVNHDLNFFIKRFDYFPKKYHRELFENIYELVESIPDEIIENMFSYKKAVLKMIQNRDFDNFSLFAPLENDLFENPKIPSFIEDKYGDCFDFDESLKEEELLVELINIDFDESNFFLDFNGNINYLRDEMDYVISAFLVESDSEYPLEVNVLENPQIKIPFSFIVNKNHFKIKISYKFKDFRKESILKNRHRKSVELDDFYMDLGIGMNSYLFIDILHKKENSIEIDDICCENGEFTIKGTFQNMISQIDIQNVVTFENIISPIEYVDDSNRFRFTIDYADLLNVPVKKWEINCKDSPNFIKLTDSFEFFDVSSKIRFINSRNKILIENDIYDIVDEISQYNNIIKDLKSDVLSLKGKNAKLCKENKHLKDNIAEFKERKVVRLVDKMKFHN